MTCWLALAITPTGVPRSFLESFAEYNLVQDKGVVFLIELDRHFLPVHPWSRRGPRVWSDGNSRNYGTSPG